MPESGATTLLVTGATGFVGRHVVAALQAAGYTRIRCLIHRYACGPSAMGGGAELVTGDVQDRKSLDRAMVGVDLVGQGLHFAGIES